MPYQIIHLPYEKWKGTTIPNQYKAEKYYDVSMNETIQGYSIHIEKRWQNQKGN